MTVPAVPGCTNPEATNHDAEANLDDGSCIVSGCMNATACNYNPAATLDNGTCDLVSCLGCTDSAACNYDATATQEDGSAPAEDAFGVDYVDCEGACLNDVDGDGVRDEEEVPGCTNPWP